MKDFYVNLGNQIKQRRLELHWTREKLAQEANISARFLFDIEIGKKGMSAEILCKIMMALDVPDDWFLTGRNCVCNERQVDLSR